MNKRILAFALCAIMLFGLVPTFTLQAEEDKEITIIAASDYQPKSGAMAGKNPLKKILDSIKAAGVTKADALFYCGDYTHSMSSLSATTEGVNAVKDVFSDVVPKSNMTFVQGNHDIMSGGSGLTPSGNNDPKSGEYGVYVINNDDYMWYNNDHNAVKNTAQRLIDYLNEKIDVGYDRPIFVLSHLPLHYSMRTNKEGDAQYSIYLLDALNKAAAKGLNIFYLFGHDHSNGWDDYLGGASVYLKKGDKILVCKAGSRTNILEKDLNFTYMNAGYTGYYSNENGSDGTLTATVFKIKGNEVTINRYDSKGLHNLKSAGVRNELHNESAYDPNLTVYTSPQTVTLTKVTNNDPVEDRITIDRSGKAYKRVENFSLLQDGKEYLLVSNGSNDYLVLPKVKVKSNNEGSRKGLEVEKTTGFANPMAYGDFDSYAFTLKQDKEGWLFMKDGKYLNMKESGSLAVTLTLEQEGTPFTFKYATGGFSIKTGDFYWNYNSRGLINGYKDPTSFYLYEYVGSALEVQNGTAKVGGNKASGAKEGETVTLSAEKFIGDMLFEKWEILGGNVTLEEGKGTSASFKMPAEPVSIKAVYKAHSHAFTEKVESDEFKAEGESYYLSCSCGLSSAGTANEQTFTPSSGLPQDPGSNGQGGSSDNTLLIVIIAVSAVIVIAGGGVGAVLLTKKKKSGK
jgi:hypothetical protein